MNDGIAGLALVATNVVIERSGPYENREFAFTRLVWGLTVELETHLTLEHIELEMHWNNFGIINCHAGRVRMAWEEQGEHR